MEGLSQPEVIFTHESDLDGLVSGLLLKRLADHLFTVDTRLEAYHLTSWQTRAMRESRAWVSDLAMEARIDRQNWLVVDHHPSEHVPRNAAYVFDQGRSASALAYEMVCQHGLGNEGLARLVHLTNTADLFVEDDPEFDLACDYAQLVKTYRFKPLLRLLEGRLENLLDHPLLKVMVTRREIEDPMGLAWSRDHMIEITPEVSLVEMTVGSTNTILNQLLREPSCENRVLMTLSKRAAYQYAVSLRSRNGRALEMARRLQGGGHANASGATLPKSIRSFSDGVRYLQQVLMPQSEPRAQALEGLEAELGNL